MTILPRYVGPDEYERPEPDRCRHGRNLAGCLAGFGVQRDPDGRDLLAAVRQPPPRYSYERVWPLPLDFSLGVMDLPDYDRYSRGGGGREPDEREKQQMYMEELVGISAQLGLEGGFSGVVGTRGVQLPEDTLATPPPQEWTYAFPVSSKETNRSAVE